MHDRGNPKNIQNQSKREVNLEEFNDFHSIFWIMAAPLPPMLWSLLKCSLCRFSDDGGILISKAALDGLARTLLANIRGISGNGKASRRFLQEFSDCHAPPFLHSEGFFLVGILKPLLQKVGVILTDDQWRKALQSIQASPIRIIERPPGHTARSSDKDSRYEACHDVSDDHDSMRDSSTSVSLRQKRIWSDTSSDCQSESGKASTCPDVDMSSILEEKDMRIQFLLATLQNKEGVVQKQSKKAKVLGQKLRRCQAALEKLQRENQDLKKSRQEFGISRIGSSSSSTSGSAWLSPLGNIILAETRLQSE